MVVLQCLAFVAALSFACGEGVFARLLSASMPSIQSFNFPNASSASPVLQLSMPYPPGVAGNGSALLFFDSSNNDASVIQWSPHARSACQGMDAPSGYYQPREFFLHSGQTLTLARQQDGGVGHRTTLFRVDWATCVLMPLYDVVASAYGGWFGCQSSGRNAYCAGKPSDGVSSLLILQLNLTGARTIATASPLPVPSSFFPSTQVRLMPRGDSSVLVGYGEDLSGLFDVEVETGQVTNLWFKVFGLRPRPSRWFSGTDGMVLFSTAFPSSPFQARGYKLCSLSSCDCSRAPLECTPLLPLDCDGSTCAGRMSGVFLGGSGAISKPVDWSSCILPPPAQPTLLIGLQQKTQNSVSLTLVDPWTMNVTQTTSFSLTTSLTSRLFESAAGFAAGTYATLTDFGRTLLRFREAATATPSMNKCSISYVQRVSQLHVFNSSHAWLFCNGTQWRWFDMSARCAFGEPVAKFSLPSANMSWSRGSVLMGDGVYMMALTANASRISIVAQSGSVREFAMGNSIGSVSSSRLFFSQQQKQWIVGLYSYASSSTFLGDLSESAVTPIETYSGVQREALVDSVGGIAYFPVGYSYYTALSLAPNSRLAKTAAFQQLNGPVFFGKQ